MKDQFNHAEKIQDKSNALGQGEGIWLITGTNTAMQLAINGGSASYNKGWNMTIHRHVFMAQQLLVVRGLLISKLHDHTHTPNSVGLLWTSDQPVAQTTNNSRNKHPLPGGNRTRIISKREAADPHLTAAGLFASSSNAQI
jgi:hypothetical protein